MPTPTAASVSRPELPITRNGSSHRPSTEASSTLGKRKLPSHPTPAHTPVKRPKNRSRIYIASQPSTAVSNPTFTSPPKPPPKSPLKATSHSSPATRTHKLPTYPDASLSIPAFVSSRAYEIRALEAGIAAAQRAGAQRAFQSVPRALRRRAGAHDVKRVPKRLRPVVEKQMEWDGVDKSSGIRERKRKVVRRKWLKLTALVDGRKKSNLTRKEGVIVPRKPHVKQDGEMREPPLPKAKWRKRQKNKTWLPTHVYHAKRARMTPVKDPLWGFALPVSPSEKSYRLTHRASTLRGAVAWDMSYMSTIALSGAERSLKNLLKALGVGQAKVDENLWSSKGELWTTGRRSWNGILYEREQYPKGIFGPASVIWEPLYEDMSKRRLLVRIHPSIFPGLWMELVKLSKVQKPAVMLHDLRYEIGSIEIRGPSSTEALVSALNPIVMQEDSASEKKSEAWKSLKYIHNLALLPANSLLSLIISDPRLNPRVEAIKPSTDKHNDEKIMKICADWPFDSIESSITSKFTLHNRESRLQATNHIVNDKSINRRRAVASNASEIRPTDPRIPILVFTTLQDSFFERGKGSQTSWTVLLPWPWVLPVWRTLVSRTPLSTGNCVRFGGIKEQRQMSAESGFPWFPGDWIGTKAGKDWNEMEETSEKKKWLAKPKGRRVEWESIDLGHGKTGEIGDGNICEWDLLFEGNQCKDFFRVTGQIANAIVHGPTSVEYEAVAGVRIRMLFKGVPGARARIYRLPQNDILLREAWTSLLPKGRSNQGSRPKLGDGNYPAIPGKEDLIGFVTSGNFNLSLGKGTGIGSVLLRKLSGDARQVEDYIMGNMQICIIREAGETCGRLAHWEFV